MSIAHPAFPDSDAASLPGGSEKMLSYEVHFYRADGTLSLRLHAAAARHDDVLQSLAKMQCREFVEIKVWRGLNRVMVRHRPARPLESMPAVPAQPGRHPLRDSEIP